VDDFERQFAARFRRAYGVAFVIVGDREDARDIAAETLARLHVHWAKVSEFATPWVVRVAGNLALDRVRKRQRQRQRTRYSRVEPVPGPDPQRIDLQRALLALPKRQRDVVILRYIADLPEAEVAGALGCSVGTVKTHASRGLGALRIALGGAR
jgi:RNA polymerase sigma-70 factor, ECF subfamily